MIAIFLRRVFPAYFNMIPKTRILASELSVLGSVIADSHLFWYCLRNESYRAASVAVGVDCAETAEEDRAARQDWVTVIELAGELDHAEGAEGNCPIMRRYVIIANGLVQGTFICPNRDQISHNLQGLVARTLIIPHHPLDLISKVRYIVIVSAFVRW